MKLCRWQVFNLDSFKASKNHLHLVLYNMWGKKTRYGLCCPYTATGAWWINEWFQSGFSNLLDFFVSRFHLNSLAWRSAGWTNLFAKSLLSSFLSGVMVVRITSKKRRSGIWNKKQNGGLSPTLQRSLMLRLPNSLLVLVNWIRKRNLSLLISFPHSYYHTNFKSTDSHRNSVFDHLSSVAPR